MMSDQLATLRTKIARLKLNESLLYLNHVLATIRAETDDVALRRCLIESKLVFPHLVHFLAKEIIVGASNFGLEPLAWDSYEELCRIVIDLGDPLQGVGADVDMASVLIRLSHQQFPAQQLLQLQQLGLSLGLYRDVGRIIDPVDFDLRLEAEEALGMSIDAFISMAFLALSARTASHEGRSCAGTFLHWDLVQLQRQGLAFCTPDKWNPFLKKAACSINGFRNECKKHDTSAAGLEYMQFAFNPLYRAPLIDVGDQLYIAPDPLLIVERTTEGLYYDLLERDHMRFTERFGYAFDAFVGQLLESAIDRERLWWESSTKSTLGPRYNAASKNADHAIACARGIVLIECKSIRPSLELTTYATKKSVEQLVDRISGAVEQLSLHAASIDRGEWTSFGIHPAKCVGLVATYGHVHGVNNAFFRRKVLDVLGKRSISPIPWAVVSLSELDSFVSLLDRGADEWQIAGSICSEGEIAMQLKNSYEPMLAENAVSAFSKRKADEFCERCLPSAETTTS